MQNQMLPAGSYYIGDPCYVIDGEGWSKFLDPYWELGKGGIFDYDNELVCAYGTQHGDGCFSCSEGKDLGVDAGIIGAIPMGIVKMGDPEEFGVVVEFPSPFKCRRDPDGRMHFGHVSVMTGDEERDEDDD